MKHLVISIVALFTLVSCGRQNGTEQVTYQGNALGTTYAVQYFSQRDLDFERSMDSIIKVINQSMSTYQDDSDISQINKGDTTITVDQNFLDVFNASVNIFETSKGFFDPTVGVLVNAYGFGPETPLTNLSPLKLDSLKQFVGLEKVRINEDHKVVKDHSSVFLDFNAIAKGYAIDRVCTFLEQQGVEDYLVELGGELRARGKNKASSKDWLVGIDDPFPDDEQERRFNAKVLLKDAAMATSGNYRKYRLDSITGQQFVHTVNPITGLAERSNLLSASVIAENCMLADGYATAIMAMGLERTMDMLKKLKSIEVYLIYSAGNGDIETYVTPGFKTNLIE